MGGRIVIWSGGIDSTALLHHYAGGSSEDYPIRALSVVAHPHLSGMFMRAQQTARRNYLKWARARGYHIRAETVAVRGRFDFPAPEGEQHRGQPLIWLGAVAQAVGEDDEVLLGYIKRDGFWHFRQQFEEAFAAACRLKGVRATLAYPWEWYDKAAVLKVLRADRVPNACWFTCEQTEDGAPCGVCYKCRELAAGEAELRAERERIVETRRKD